MLRQAPIMIGGYGRPEGLASLYSRSALRAVKSLDNKSTRG